jgi:Ca2+-binding EF-hand superfamily protein
MKVFVNYLNEDEINEIKRAFQIIDKDKTGVIKMSQLSTVIENSGVKIDKEELEDIIKQISQDQPNEDEL